MSDVMLLYVNLAVTDVRTMLYNVFEINSSLWFPSFGKYNLYARDLRISIFEHATLYVQIALLHNSSELLLHFQDSSKQVRHLVRNGNINTNLNIFQ